MSEAIQAIFIRETETRVQPKPHTVYKVEVHAAVRNWVIWKRYSEFTKLDAQFHSIFPEHPPPGQLPTRHWFSSTFGDTDRIEDRRRGLEEYLRGILSCRDDRWRQTEVWREFLSIPSGRSLDGKTLYTSETWLDEYKNLTGLAREIRTLINRRTAHIERDEIPASHTCTVQARKLAVTLATRLSNLETSLVGLAKGAVYGDVMSEGELRRRQDMINTLKEDKDVLLKLINTGRREKDLLQENQAKMDQPTSMSDRKSLLNVGGSPTSPTSEKNGTMQNVTKTNMKRSRAFGAAALKSPPQETSETLPLDNDALVQLQQRKMEDQDSQINEFSAILTRQAQLGLAIGNELEIQNQLLDDLDGDLGRTQAKLKFANKKLSKIN